MLRRFNRLETSASGTRCHETIGVRHPLAVNALPVDYKATEKAALSVWIRFRPGYGGYHLTLHTRDILKSFSLVSSGP